MCNTAAGTAAAVPATTATAACYYWYLLLLLIIAAVNYCYYGDMWAVLAERRYVGCYMLCDVTADTVTLRRTSYNTHVAV